jgi:hypothetical protein
LLKIVPPATRRKGVQLSDLSFDSNVDETLPKIKYKKLVNTLHLKQVLNFCHLFCPSAPDGIQAVSGSIPLISTKTLVFFENQGFFLILH